MLTTNLDKPIKSVKITGRQENSPQSTEQVSKQDWQAQNTEISHVCQTLKNMVNRLNEFYDEIFAKHKQEIARLSVEIARKILVQKVQDGDYEIESIVQEALKNAPARHDIVVHLNPADIAQCQKLQQNDPNGTLADIKFVSDAKIGRAECLLETPKGIIESVIAEHLERIAEALKKSE
jgi:flagellar biosynthesis/type III secretory pathway protein FliH